MQRNFLVPFLMNKRLLFTCQCIYLISVTSLQNDQNGGYIQKSQTWLCFVLANTWYLLNQHRQLTDESNFLLLFFAKVPSIKYIRWNKPIFLIPSPLYAIWEKNGITKTIDYAFGYTPSLPLALTRIRTLSMDPKLKTSIERDW